MGRQNIIVLICGRRNCGKSTLLQKILGRYKNRVLVYDTDLNPIFSDYKEIYLHENWTKLKAGFYRCSDENFELFFDKVNKEFSNGCLALDDIRKYAGTNGQLPQSLRALCIKSKQRNIDIYCSQHSFSQIIKQLHVYADLYIFFDFAGGVDNTPEVADIYEDLVAMLDYVKEQATVNPHFYSSLKRGDTFNAPETPKNNESQRSAA